MFVGMTFMGRMTLFSEFGGLCEKLRSTSKRSEKVAMMSKFLASLQGSEINAACLFILGKAFPDHDPRTLNVSWRTLQKVLSQVKERMDDSAMLSVLEVSKSLAGIAETSGKGARQSIEELLETLLSQTDKSERAFLTKIIFGEMRIGVAEGLLLESIAAAAAVSPDLVRRANMYVGNPGEVAKVALLGGVEALSQIDLQLFRPVRPMLAELAEDFVKVFKEHQGRTSLEFKFDGARVQIHKQESQIRVYSRHLTDVTASLPELTEIANEKCHAHSAVVEGEVVAVGRNARPLPFQELMRRYRRVHHIETIRKEVPIRLYLFDLLYLNGRSYVEAPYSQRIHWLEQSCDADILATRLVTDDEKDAERFLQDALEQGHEGLMAKDLGSEYTPGARGKKWFKIKPAETLDLVIIAADWGSGRRVGWLSNYHLAVRDESTGEFLDLGKTFKGLTDEQFRWMTDKLLSLKVNENNYTVYVKPEVVVEVAYNEIQSSPQYKSKFALRFARIKRIREDKTPAQVDSISRVQNLYESQFEHKARRADAT